MFPAPYFFSLSATPEAGVFAFAHLELLSSRGPGLPRDLLFVFQVPYTSSLSRSSSLVEFVARRYLALDIDHDCVALPVLHQLVLAQMAQKGLLHQIHALVFHQLRVGF